MSNPLISVVIPNYNYRNFLGTAVQSVRNQTYKNWELIIVDDNSTDGSQAFIRKMETNHPRITAFYHDENQGHAATFNDGIRNAKGEYVHLLSPDDCMLAQNLEFKSRVLEQVPECGMVTSRRQVVAANNPVRLQRWQRTYPASHWLNYQVYRKTRSLWKSLMPSPDQSTSIEHNLAPAGTVLRSKRIFEHTGGFPTDLQVKEDQFLHLKMISEAPLVYLPFKLIVSHKTSGGISRGIQSREDFRERIHAHRHFIEKAREQFDGDQIQDEEFEFAEEKLLLNGFRRFILYNDDFPFNPDVLQYRNDVKSEKEFSYFSVNYYCLRKYIKTNCLKLFRNIGGGECQKIFSLARFYLNSLLTPKINPDRNAE